MNPQIFREYDIRGVADQDMTDLDVFHIGKGIGTFLSRFNHRRITVGRDCRITSDRYAELLIQGLMDSGCAVLDIGVCPTPLLYFSIHYFEQEGGVMVTASHNPSHYNGFKICSGTDSVFGSQLQEIRNIIETGRFLSEGGKLERADIVSPYIDFIGRNIRIPKPLRVGVDAGNGTAGVVAVPLLRRLGMEVHDLYCDMDGTFPNHEADPTVHRNMTDLIRLVTEKKLDVGIGYDGDGDRIGVVDERGNIIYGDKLMILFAREILSRKPGSAFVSEVKCSQTLYDDITSRGGRAVMWKTGHSLIKAKIKEVQAELAGEMSGHLFFADRYLGYDDALYASCRLLEILADTGKRIEELLDGIPPTFTTPEIRVECPDHLKFPIVGQIASFFSQHYPVIDIDGARVLFPGGWGLVRASNTQPALVLRFEAESEHRLSEIRDIVESRLRKISETGQEES